MAVAVEHAGVWVLPLPLPAQQLSPSHSLSSRLKWILHRLSPLILLSSSFRYIRLVHVPPGKGTLIELLQKSFPEGKFGFSVSHTTRKPREGEEDGVHYNFSTVEEIKKEIDDGKFVEYAEVHGNYYGTR